MGGKTQCIEDRNPFNGIYLIPPFSFSGITIWGANDVEMESHKHGLKQIYGNTNI